MYIHVCSPGAITTAKINGVRTMHYAPHNGDYSGVQEDTTKFSKLALMLVPVRELGVDPGGTGPVGFDCSGRN